MTPIHPHWPVIALSILFGALLTVATATALGLLLLRALSIPLNRLEEGLLGFITGSACLSGVMFVLCATHLVSKGALLAISGVAIAAAVRWRGHALPPDSLPDIPRIWAWIFGIVFAAFTVLYFFNAMAPEHSPDGAGYHLPLVANYYRAHGFVRITTNIYASLSQGVELLFLFAFSFGRHSAAALVHFAFLATLPWLVLCFGRRFTIPSAGAAAAIFVFVSPVVGIDGTSAYVDVALAAVLFSLYYFLQLWGESGNSRLLVPVGILAGFAFAIKLTAFPALCYAIGFILWTLWRAGKPMFRPACLVTGLALLFILPWPIKNWLWVQNPLAPFGNHLFPNPYVHINFEDDYRAFFMNYDVANKWKLPYLLTVDGNTMGGILGPLFLLAPISLLALRTRQGRQLLLAAVVLGTTYFTNIGTRFLIPVLPFIALAMAIALERIPSLLITLAIAHAVASWPNLMGRYASPYAWHLEPNIPFAPALRMEPEDAYLRRRFACYLTNRMIEEKVPAGGPVLSMGDSCSAYTSRPILVDFQAASNQVLGDIISAPLYQSFQPTQIQTFHFAERTATKIRVVTTASSKTSMWDIAELRVYDSGHEVPRAPTWRLTSKPNPWEIQLAFDNDQVTRWRAWQTGEPGMYVEVDFGREQKLDLVALESASYLHDPELRLEATDKSGKWVAVDSQPIETAQQVSPTLRRAATLELKLRGVRYLLVPHDHALTPDLDKRPRAWGVKLIGDAGGSRLFYIE